MPAGTPSRGNGAESVYLTRARVAAMLGVSPNTVARWARDGRISCQKTLGGHRRFDRREVEALLEELRASGARRVR